jgi:hypothetical protein
VEVHEVTKIFLDWWNKGRNQRVADEDSASWGDLIRDDFSQITRSEEVWKSGGGQGLKGWRPLKAFSPGMLKTGPTPLVRQVVERPVNQILNSFKLSLIRNAFD